MKPDPQTDRRRSEAALMAESSPHSSGGLHRTGHPGSDPNGLRGPPPAQREGDTGRGGASSPSGLTDQPAATIGETSTELEEQVEALPGEEAPAFNIGERVNWGELEVTVQAALRDGWFRAMDPNGTVIVLRPGQLPHADALTAHPLTGSLVRHIGPEGVAIADTGQVISGRLAPAEAVERLIDLARFVRDLSQLGLAMVDVDPQALVQTPDGVRLARWPLVVAVGEPRPLRHREGISPPELAYESDVTGKEGVYLVGAILAFLLGGEPLGPEGVVGVLGAVATAPGVPQLLTAFLAPAPSRPDPAECLARVMSVSEVTPPGLLIGAATTIGCNPDRLVNEDGYGVANETLACAATFRQLTRAAVADGMGGMAAGDEASQAALDAFLSAEAPQSLEGDALADWAVDLGWAANDAVLSRLASRDGGCTLTGIVVDGARYAMVHAGDSRAYLAGPKTEEVRLLSRDHSLAAALVASDQLDPADADTSPERNQLLRSLGSERRRRPEYFGELDSTTGSRCGDLEIGSVLVLVSDGVWSVVGGQILKALLADAARDPQAAAESLVDAAVSAGGPDNATAVVVARVR